MRFADATSYLGTDYRLEEFQRSDQAALSRMLDRYCVDQAVVVSLAAFRFEVEYGNEEAFEAARKDERLLPVPVVLPDSGGEVGEEGEYVRSLVSRGARCAAFFPKSCSISLDEMVVSALLSALEELHLPLIIPGDEADSLAISRLARRHRDLPFIYASPSYRDRNLMAVLRDCANIYLTIGAPFAGNLAIEEICRRFGPERLLYSSNFPVSEPGAAIGYLMYADIPEASLEMIARGNLQRLVAGVEGGDGHG